MAPSSRKEFPRSTAPGLRVASARGAVRPLEALVLFAGSAAAGLLAACLVRVAL